MLRDWAAEMAADSILGQRLVNFKESSCRASDGLMHEALGKKWSCGESHNNVT